LSTYDLYTFLELGKLQTPPYKILPILPIFSHSVLPCEFMAADI